MNYWSAKQIEEPSYNYLILYIYEVMGRLWTTRTVVILFLVTTMMTEFDFPIFVQNNHLGICCISGNSFLLSNVYYNTWDQDWQ